MRYQGSDSQLMIPASMKDGDFIANFKSTHMREFSFVDDSRKITVDDVRVRASGSSHRLHERSYYHDLKTLKLNPAEYDSSTKYKKVYFDDGWSSVPVLPLDKVEPGTVVQGPAMIIDNTKTILVNPSSHATVLKRHIVIDLVIDHQKTVNTD
jgi:5-oxoprolinase (ATP-hydrolysing)